MQAYELEAMVQEQEGFAIRDDRTAEWALAKIKAAREDTKRWDEFYSEQFAKAKERNDQTEAFFMAHLGRYFQIVPKHETKTQAKYELPSGSLVLKHPGPKFERDDPALAAFLIANSMSEYVEIVQKPLWGELKKACNVLGDGTVIETESGLVVEGVKAVPQPDRFEVSIN